MPALCAQISIRSNLPLLDIFGKNLAKNHIWCNIRGKLVSGRGALNVFLCVTTVKQILANNSTTLRYLKNTRYLGVNRGRIIRRIGGYYSTQVIFKSELSNSGLTICALSLAFIFELVRTGLIFVLRLNTIWSFKYRALN